MQRLIFFVVTVFICALGVRGELTRCGHYDGVKLNPGELSLDSAKRLACLDLSGCAAAEPAFMQLDRQGDSTLHITINGPCRYDFLTSGDTLRLVRIERPGRFVQFDSPLQFAPLAANQPVMSHSREHQAEHFVLDGKLESERSDGHSLIAEPGDTIQNISIYTYRHQGHISCANYKYQVEDSAMTAPVQRNMALWYAPGMKYPSALWIETTIGAGEPAWHAGGLYVFPTTASGSQEQLRTRSRNNPSPTPGNSGEDSCGSRTGNSQLAIDLVDITADAASGTISMRTTAECQGDVLVSDLQGRVYYNGRIGPDAVTIGSLPPGEYIISTGGDRPEVRKVILR